MPDLKRPANIPFSAWEPMSDEEKVKAQIAARFPKEPPAPLPPPAPSIIPEAQAAPEKPPVNPYTNFNNFVRKKK